MIIASEKLKMKEFQEFAVEGYPACGTPKATLAYHKLNGETLAERIITITNDREIYPE